MKILFSTIILCFFCTQFVSAADLELNIAVSKNIFLTAEPIEVGVTLKNSSNQIIMTKYPHPSVQTLRLDIIDDAGNIVPYNGYYASGEKISLELQPNEEFYQLLVLDELFGTGYSTELYNMSIDPGNYSIQAFFTDGVFNIASDTISIEVVPPSGKELDVYTEFLRISNSNNNTNQQNILDVCNKYLMLVEHNPSSVYSPTILVQLSALYYVVLKDKHKAEKILKKLLQEYPGSGKCRNHITTILDSIPSKSGKIDFLQKVKTQSKGSLMEKIYNKKLAEIN